MNRIQLISNGVYDVNECNITFSDFDDFQSLDKFDINIFDFNNSNLCNNILKNNGSGNFKVYNSLISRINGSAEVIKIFLYPENVYLDSRYFIEKSLSNKINEFSVVMTKFTNLPFKSVQFDKTESMVANKEISADFYFEFISEDYILTSSIHNEKKITTYNIGKTCVTTLKLINYDEYGNVNFEDLLLFLDEFVNNHGKTNKPNWYNDIAILNDDFLKNEIVSLKKEIDDNNRKITINHDLLNNNEMYKSILIENGKNLERVCKKIVSEIFNIDAEKFIDMKKEDFSFCYEDNIILCEIKGTTDNIKRPNLGQLNAHVDDYIDENDVDENKIVKLLIMNYQRDRNINDRDEVHINIINLAKKYDILIITTQELLSLYEKFIVKDLSKKEIIQYLMSEKGLLKVEDLKKN